MLEYKHPQLHFWQYLLANHPYRNLYDLLLLYRETKREDQLDIIQESKPLIIEILTEDVKGINKWISKLFL